MKLPYLRKSEDLLRKAESERENIVWEWKELQRFLRDQEELLLRQLEELEKDIIVRRDEHLSRHGHGGAGREEGETEPLSKSLRRATKGRKNQTFSKWKRDFEEMEYRFYRFSRKRIELKEVLCTFKELLKLELEEEADEYVSPGAQEKSTGYFRFLQSCRRTGGGLALTQQTQPVSFEEVSVCFSKGEWSLLGPSQRVLYKEVMQENYENVTSLVLSLTGLGPNSWMEEEDEAVLGLRSQLSEKGGNQDVSIAASQEQEKSKEKGKIEKAKEKTEKEKETSEKEKEKTEKEKEKEKMEKEKEKSEKEKEKEKEEKIEKEKEKMEEKRQTEEMAKEKEKEKEKENNPHPANVKEIIAQGALRKDMGLRPEEPTTYPQRKSERQREAGQKTREEVSVLSPTDRQNTSKVLLQPGIGKGRKPKPCPKCGKEFNQHLLLLKHKQMHQRTTPYQCSDCGKVFSQRAHLTKHEKAHKKEKLFSCSDCGKTFHRSSHFYSHQRTHRGLKPFKCSGCGKSYTRMPDLRRHQKSHTGEKSHKCFDCGKSFGLYSSLVKHERTHTGDKPYKCSHCPKSFCQRTHLIVHKRTHTKDRPFKCLLCKAGFIQKAHLISHQRSHTGEKPFRCHSCGKSFKRNSTRVKHEKRHEKESAEPSLPLKASPSALPLNGLPPLNASPSQRPSWRSRLRTVGRLGKAAA
ncbi:zinc finger protein interacting with ribonucleoprotein K-like [Ahaetulla prasina]|uniref:zinc finger protein interacting with ribonucleoprotein K-like n=1 Tax=Ahaetulla prasina TaxID=499056 RepID=UPI00264737CD|nr:zinc finger protein interacting with ribonucleoprotein K-like [Ahaetulla prasina]